jgi:hypothetical protein
LFRLSLLSTLLLLVGVVVDMAMVLELEVVVLAVIEHQPILLLLWQQM